MFTTHVHLQLGFAISLTKKIIYTYLCSLILVKPSPQTGLIYCLSIGLKALRHIHLHIVSQKKLYPFNGHHFADDKVKRIFLNENIRTSINMSLKFVPKGKINNKSALVEVMAWRRTGDKPLSEPMLPSSQTHICGTRGRWITHLDASCRTKLLKVKKNLVTSKMRNHLIWLPTNDKTSRNYHCFIACPCVTEN